MLPWSTQSLRQCACRKRRGEKETARNWQVTPEREAGLSKNRTEQNVPQSEVSKCFINPFFHVSSCSRSSLLLTEMNSRCSQITAKAHSTSGEDKAVGQKLKIKFTSHNILYWFTSTSLSKAFVRRAGSIQMLFSFLRRRAVWSLFLHDKSDNSFMESATQREVPCVQKCSWFKKTKYTLLKKVKKLNYKEKNNLQAHFKCISMLMQAFSPLART